MTTEGYFMFLIKDHNSDYFVCAESYENALSKWRKLWSFNNGEMPASITVVGSSVSVPGCYRVFNKDLIK